MEKKKRRKKALQVSIQRYFDSIHATAGDSDPSQIKIQYLEKLREDCDALLEKRSLDSEERENTEAPPFSGVDEAIRLIDAALRDTPEIDLCTEEKIDLPKDAILCVTKKCARERREACDEKEQLFASRRMQLQARPKAASAPLHRRISILLQHLDPSISKKGSLDREQSLSFSATAAPAKPTKPVAAHKAEPASQPQPSSSSQNSPSIFDKIYKYLSATGSGSLNAAQLQAFTNILFLVSSIPPSLSSQSIFSIMLRSSTDASLLSFLSQIRLPRSTLGGTDYAAFISSLSKVRAYLPKWYYTALVLASKSLDGSSNTNMLSAILLYLSRRLSVQVKNNNALQGALIYPSIMLLLGTVGLFVLVTRILPQNISIFESMNLTVPRVLQLANYLVRNVQYHWLALLFLLPRLLPSSAGYLQPLITQLKYQYIKFHTPLQHLKFLQDKAALLYMLSMLDKEQLSRSKLLLVCTNLAGSDNVVLQHMMESLASMSKHGATAEEILSYLLKQKHVFSPYEIAYLQACFMSGKHSIIQDGLRYISQMTLQQYQKQLNSLVSAISPVAIVIVGLLIIVIAALGIYPLIELSATVSASASAGGAGGRQ